MHSFQPDGKIIARYTRGGNWFVARIDPQSGQCETFDLPYSNLSRSSINVVGKSRIYTIAGSPTEVDSSLIEIDLQTGKAAVIRRSSPIETDPRYIAGARRIEFPTEDGKTAHAFFITRPPTRRLLDRQASRRRCWYQFTAGLRHRPRPHNIGSERNIDIARLRRLRRELRRQHRAGREYRNRLR